MDIEQSRIQLFQFQSGAIKRPSYPQLIEVTPRFQFQSGAIKRKQIIKRASIILKFQFQSGAIKSTQIVFNIPAFPTFQFQSGAIKRLNSSLESLWISSFNSKVVRLKVLRHTCGTKLAERFQFQSGAIKSQPTNTPFSHPQ